MDSLEALDQRRLVSIAEDLEYFRGWWANPEQALSDVEIRHASGALRRLLVEDAAGRAWRGLGFDKSPKIKGPDLMAVLAKQGRDISMSVIVVAAGVRHGGIDWSCMGAFRVNNPQTKIPANAESGFALLNSVVARQAVGATAGELDPLIEKEWYLPRYLEAAGLIRFGTIVSRREVLQHVANEMGGVHIGADKLFTSGHPRKPTYESLVDSEDRIHLSGRGQQVNGLYIELLAIGQAVGRSDDLQNLARDISKNR